MIRRHLGVVGLRSLFTSSSRRRSRRFDGPPPSRWLYPALAPFLSVAVCAGLAAARGLGRGLGVGGVLGDLRAEGLTHGYVGICTALLLAALGAVLGRREDRLFVTSTTDQLTAVANRSCFDLRCMQELARAVRAKAQAALLVIDVDRLKEINDLRGHAAGDRVLRAVGRCLRAGCRSRDLVARWGGDEFVILAPKTDSAGALVLAKRLCARIAAAAPGHGVPPFTVSVGVADLRSAGAADPEALFLAADQALYAAKASGRNRIRLAPLPPEPVERSGHVVPLDDVAWNWRGRSEGPPAA